METRLCDFPAEILIHIFDFIPNKWNLSLVCWKFYEIVCETEKEKFSLKLIDLDDTEKFESMVNTKRSFDRMKIVNFRSHGDHVMLRIKQVCERFNESIKNLEIASSIMKESEVHDLLNIISRVEEITFYDVEFSEEIQDINKILGLHNLRKFNFHLCNVTIPRIVLKLPKSELRSLSIENCILKQETLEKIFNNQRNIKELEFDPYYVNWTSVQHLRLKKMKLMSNRNVLEIIKEQKELEFLDLSKAHIGNNGFLEACNLKSLEKLKLWIDKVSWELLVNLNKLTNLTELSLNYDRLEVEYIGAISRTQMPNIKKLKIKFPRLKITAENFAEISRSFPSVNHLHISNQSIGVFRDLITNFKNLETLVIGCDSDSSEVVDFCISRDQHLKLKELCVYSSYPDQQELKCSTTILEIINNVLPNLKKLKLQNVINVSTENLRHILSSHDVLTHLNIDLPRTITVIDNEFLEILQDRGKNLEHFQARGAEISLHKKMIEKKFRFQFSTIIVKPWKLQILLKNVKWQHSNEF